MRGLRWWLGFVVVLCGMLAGCGGSSSSSGAPQFATLTMARGAGLITPFIASIRPNGVLTWRNDDTIPHTLRTTPDTNNFLNPTTISLTVAPGHSETLRLSAPGAYDVYDETYAQWNETDHHVAARADAPAFPLAMEAVIYVPGSIPNLAKLATNTIPMGKDLFEQDFVAVPDGGTVGWHNASVDVHTISLVDGWDVPINPASINTLTLGGVDAANPDGQTEGLVFPAPGLYYYFCSEHATVDPVTHRARPIEVGQEQPTEYPIPMEGFVFVAG